MIFQAYRELSTQLRVTKRELEELNQSHRIVLKVPGPTILQYKEQVGGFRNAFDGSQDIEAIKNVHLSFRQQLLKERFLKDNNSP